MRCPSSSSTPLSLCFVALVGAFSLAATCENQEFFLPHRLTLSRATFEQPSVVAHVLPYRGRNSLDYTIANTGTQVATFGVAVAMTCDSDEICTARTFTEVIGPIAAGADTRGRFPGEELGIADTIEIQFQCLEEAAEGACTGELRYSLVLQQVECRDDSECSPLVCELNAGRCVVAEDTEETGGCACRNANPIQPRPLIHTVIGLVLLAWLTARRKRIGRGSR